MIDYLNQIRERTINELTKAQEETLYHYSAHFKSNDHENIYKENNYFQVLYKPDDPKYAEPWIFSLFTFITDFYMSPTDINLLEYLFY